MARSRFGFRHLAAVTAALTFALILLGVYTGARGAGLACSAQWPACDGGLLPQTLPSLIEWLHRLVAMVTGFFILGVAVAAWRGDHAARVQYAAGAALVLTPVQFLLGRSTIVDYGVAAQVAHHAAALLIFTAVLAATLWAYEEAPTGDSREDTTAAA